MSLRISAAATRTYDALKQRPGAHVRRSDARDPATLEAVHARLADLAGSYRIGTHAGPGGATYVFWSEIDARIREGAFDDLLANL